MALSDLAWFTISDYSSMTIRGSICRYLSSTSVVRRLPTTRSYNIDGRAVKGSPCPARTESARVARYSFSSLIVDRLSTESGSNAVREYTA